MKIDLFLSRAEIQPNTIKRRVAIIVDVLRASTSIITALTNGCQGVIPVAEVEEARKLAKAYPAESVLLAGERNEMPISGFDLSNSPLDYTAERVNNKRIIFTSSNGSKLFSYAHDADITVVGGFINITILSNYIVNCDLDVAILCAGKNGYFALEDAVCGGMIIEKIVNSSSTQLQLNDGAVASQILYRHYAHHIGEMLLRSSHGKRLLEIGQEKDIASCGSIDSAATVPLLRGNELISSGKAAIN